MKPHGKRIPALLLAAALTAGTALGGTPAAKAAQTEATDAYVLNFDEGGQPFLYGSRYQMKHSYNDPDAGTSSVWTYWNAPEIFNLVYTDAEGVSKSIAAYCTDVDTSTAESTYYRRINLEDSTYHESGAAERLRSVILNSFPYLTVEQVAQAVNAAVGEGTVTQLTQGEVLSATQQAIWEITHGDKYTVDLHYTSLRSLSGYDTTQFVYPESLTDCVASDYTLGNITALYEYFLSLEGTAPLADAVSEYTFEDVTYACAQEEDGTYTVTVTYTVNTTVSSGDILTLTASCGEQAETCALTAGAGSVTFEGLAVPTEVTLEINGYQTGGDVYLFDALGDRTASQSMVGYDATTLPVHGEVTVGPDRTVTIHKTTSEDDGKIPLANIEFELYLAATMEEIESGAVVLSETPTDEEIALYQTDANYVTTLKTDALGNASYNLTENGWPDGVYLVAEVENPAVLEPVAPFFVLVPGTSGDGSTRVYDVEISPKNVTESGPDIKKDVTEIENDYDTFDVDETHVWIIRGGVPAGMATAVKYVITDTLDYRLTLQENFVVTVAKETDAAYAETVTLTADIHYTVTVDTTTDAAGHEVDCFTVALTAEGMTAVIDAVTAGTGNVADYEVRVYFDAAINQNAQLGVEIPNQATLEYTNSAGVDYEVESDIPEVHTGGTNLLKVDSRTEAALAGATFRIARLAEADELEDAVALTVNGTKLSVVFVDFYDGEDLTEKVSQITTGEDGKAAFCGLAYGTYYLVETKAPTGYSLLSSPVTVVIDGDSHTETETVTVVNTRFILPETGDIGLVLFLTVGVLALGSSAVLFIAAAKKKEQE